MDEKRKGSQEPSVWFTLPYEKSNGEEAVRIYEKTGRTAFDWQKGLLEDILAINEDGLYVHTSFGYSVPRQNGKNEVVAMRELYGLAKGERILHTAHRSSTSHAAWERLLNLLGQANIGITSSFRAFGKEHIYTESGGRIEFRTRTSSGGLGETFDVLVIDEAQEYQDDHASALKYTIVSSENPQTIYLGTPPTPISSGTKFPEYRKKTLCGERRNSGWAEWSVEDMTEMSNVDAWYKTNPSLGYTLSERAIEDEIESDATDFNIQRLGLWITYNQKSAISKQEWASICVDKLPELVGQMGVGIKFNRDGTTCAMSIALKTKDGKTFVETIGCKSMRDGVEWLITFLLPLKDQYCRVLTDGANGVELLTKAMKDVGLKAPTTPTTKEYIDANSDFEQKLFKKELCHMEQPGVEKIVSNCEKRPIGSAGGFGYRSISIDADVSILDSMILAIYCVNNLQAKKKQSFRY